MKKSTLALQFLALSYGFILPSYSQAQEKIFNLDADVVLSSLIALSDQHIENLADSMRLLAASPEVQSGDWNKIRPLLEVAGKLNIDALNWFALPNGTYWSVQEGHEPLKLADRPYFSKALKGKTVIGDLLLSKATGKPIAVIAVPVVRPDKSVVGVLGASVYLETLTALLEKEMNLDDKTIFYSFDSTPILGLVWDPIIILADPKKLGKEVSQAFDRMLKQDQGTVAYTFRGKRRTVIFRKSALTGWRYALGRVPEGHEKKGTTLGSAK